MATQTVDAVDQKLLAAGEWLASGKWAEVRSPYDDTVVGRVAIGDAAATVDRAIAAAPSSTTSPGAPQFDENRPA